MPNLSGRCCLQSGLVGAALLLTHQASFAQSIVAESDTATQVRQLNNQFEITGGVSSADGANLFHGFQQFGLSAEQVANFVSPAEVRNIVGRVTGGQASYLDGLLQVSGSTANLFLLNPAGMLFGPNARLDLSGDFTATTATGLTFGDRALTTLGDNNYAALVGNPTGFIFAGAAPAAIANAGDLAVAPGRSLALIGGTVANTGTLTAAEGSLLVAAVPGESLVRLSHPAMLLSLEVAPLPATTPGAVPTFQPLDLPTLLTGGSANGSTGLSMNADGSVSLVNQTGAIAAELGTTIVSGRLDTAGTTGGQIAVVGDRIAVVDATLDASGQNGGGTLRIGGDYQGQGSLPNAAETLISTNSSLLASAEERGNGGRIIVWSDEATHFLGHAIAQGGQQSGDGGFVEVSSAQLLDFTGTVDTLAPAGTVGTLLIDPPNIRVDTSGSSTADTTVILANNLASTLTSTDGQLQADNNVTFAVPINISQSGLGLSVDAGNNIFADDVRIGSGPINFRAGNNITVGNLRGQTISLIAGEDITVSTLAAAGLDAGNSADNLAGQITVQAGGLFRATGAGNIGNQSFDSSLAVVDRNNTGTGTLTLNIGSETAVLFGQNGPGNPQITISLTRGPLLIDVGTLPAGVSGTVSGITFGNQNGLLSTSLRDLAFVRDLETVTAPLENIADQTTDDENTIASENTAAATGVRSAEVETDCQVVAIAPTDTAAVEIRNSCPIPETSSP
ncbi:filamentous hemagglutinin N-terminal domain-containing protein [Sphaerothrix gracilis]|uniref:two-partner secretion domain-containing protein n=1 Tax=Sphaerothrix gracilis TaxID=3151835 RepID=UPI0031FCA598